MTRRKLAAAIAALVSLVPAPGTCQSSNDSAPTPGPTTLYTVDILPFTMVLDTTDEVFDYDELVGIASQHIGEGFASTLPGVGFDRYASLDLRVDAMDPLTLIGTAYFSGLPTPSSLLLNYVLREYTFASGGSEQAFVDTLSQANDLGLRSTVSVTVANPTDEPTSSPSKSPTDGPTALPSTSPSMVPSTSPSADPSDAPTFTPSDAPSIGPSARPTSSLSAAPTAVPSAEPSTLPSESPTSEASSLPSFTPSDTPSLAPSAKPSAEPSTLPSESPSSKTSKEPSSLPTDGHSRLPSFAPSDAPSVGPSAVPSADPSSVSRSAPSVSPSARPILSSLVTPTDELSAAPTDAPTSPPTDVPSLSPTGTPTLLPTDAPTFTPRTRFPTRTPSVSPTAAPVEATDPTPPPTSEPTWEPTAEPTSEPTAGIPNSPLDPPNSPLDPPPIDQTPTDPLTELNAAMARWSSTSTYTYEYATERSCFCSPFQVRPMYVVVSGTEKMSITYLDTGAAVSSRNTANVLTIEEQFVLIRDAIFDPAVTSVVNYDPVRGYPTDIDYITGDTSSDFQLSNVVKV